MQGKRAWRRKWSLHWGGACRANGLPAPVLALGASGTTRPICSSRHWSKLTSHPGSFLRPLGTRPPSLHHDPAASTSCPPGFSSWAILPPFSPLLFPSPTSDGRHKPVALAARVSGSQKTPEKYPRRTDLQYFFVRQLFVGKADTAFAISAPFWSALMFVQFKCNGESSSIL